MHKKQEFEHIASVIKTIRFAMLTTMGANGEHGSRPMTNQKVDVAAGKIFFIAPDSAQLCRDISSNPQVNVAYADTHKNLYVSVSGTATVAYDVEMIHELWNAEAKAWFPDGPQDPKIRVVTIDIHRADSWEATGSKIVQLVSYAKSLLTGSTPKLGEHRQADLHS